jgi:signal transduction histidine kinase
LATVPGIWVDADVQQLKQVLINLIRNSVEAIGRNGSITLSTRRGMVELEGRTRSVAILAVADTGKGMPPEIQSRLFDPFFTTKETGTGLGLAIAARIVQKHGGILRYETTVNRGTIFEVVLAEATAADVDIGQGQRKSFLPC